jgi:lipopolysaccharide/colanic/teichoic acid biosynthesis glycosyltransferase
MYLILKRSLDLIVSGIVLILLLPVFIPITIALRFTAEGEVFYFQKRIGYKNRYFQIWKFATMLKNSPNMGSGSITLRNDTRVTPVGKLLRISKFNELPQIINVLKGDMSLVGPRPLVDKTFNDYSEEVKRVIYNSKPGITGIGSIIFRDEEKMISESNMDPHEFYEKMVAPYKGELELWYQKNKSTYVDLVLIFLTAWVIIFPKSELLHSVFKDLPKRPESIRIKQEPV